MRIVVFDDEGREILSTRLSAEISAELGAALISEAHEAIREKMNRRAAERDKRERERRPLLRPVSPVQTFDAFGTLTPPDAPHAGYMDRHAVPPGDEPHVARASCEVPSEVRDKVRDGYSARERALVEDSGARPRILRDVPATGLPGDSTRVITTQERNRARAACPDDCVYDGGHVHLASGTVVSSRDGDTPL